MEDRTPQDQFRSPPAGAAEDTLSDGTGRMRHNTRIISSQEQKRAFRLAHRHSRRVTILKWSLPVITLAIVAGFIGWVSRNTPTEAPLQVQLEEGGFKQDELVMQNPNLNGFTDGRAYEVTANEATQKVETPNVINLKAVRARITDEKQQWVTINADAGVFNQKEETLGLDGSVKVDSSLGYKLDTDEVAVDMPKGYMKTISPVTITSRDIRLSSNQLEAINNGEQFRFSGNVRLYIDAALLNKSTGQDDPAQDKNAQPVEKTPQQEETP